MLRSWHGRRELPAVVARMGRDHQDLYRLLYWEGAELPAAADRLRAAGHFPDGLHAVRAAAAELWERLPRGARIARARTVSLQGPGGAGAGEAELGDSIPAAGEAPPDATTRVSAEESLGEILGDLGEDERALLRVYFLEGLEAAALAPALGLTNRGQVYRRVHQLMERLRTAMSDAGLEPEDAERLAHFDWARALAPADGVAP